MIVHLIYVCLFIHVSVHRFSNLNGDCRPDIVFELKIWLLQTHPTPSSYTHIYTYWSVCLSICLAVGLSVCLPACLLASCLPACRLVGLFPVFPMHTLANNTIFVYLHVRQLVWLSQCVFPSVFTCLLPYLLLCNFVIDTSNVVLLLCLGLFMNIHFFSCYSCIYFLCSSISGILYHFVISVSNIVFYLSTTRVSMQHHP